MGVCNGVQDEFFEVILKSSFDYYHSVSIIFSPAPLNEDVSIPRTLCPTYWHRRVESHHFLLVQSQLRFCYATPVSISPVISKNSPHGGTEGFRPPRHAQTFEAVRHSRAERREDARSVLWLHGCEPCARSERAFPSIPQQEKERRKHTIGHTTYTTIAIIVNANRCP